MFVLTVVNRVLLVKYFMHCSQILLERGGSRQLVSYLLMNETHFIGMEGTSFQNRKSLPQEWRGLRDEELSKKAEIDGCVFVHASGFIGGNKTLDGVLEMARKAVDWDDEPDKKRLKTQ
jgi:uncharacterized UPF0160 family protein